MAISHTTSATFPNDASHELSSDAWNEDHTIDNATVTAAMLATTGTASASTALHGDMSWKVPGASTYEGHPRQLFVRPDGDDLDDGLTWGTGKATIQGAYAEMDSYLADNYSGGVIWMSRGEHPAGGGLSVLEGHAPKIIGMGPRDTKLIIDQADVTAMNIQADGTIVRDLAIRDEVSGGHAHGGIYVQDAQQVELHNVWFQLLSQGRDMSANTFADSPFALKVQGPGAFADWNVYSKLVFEGCGRGVLIGGGTNGWFVNTLMYGGEGQYGHIWVYREAQPSGQDDVTHYWVNTWLAGGPYGAGGTPAGGYQIRLEENFAGSTSTSQVFVNLNLELSNAARGSHFIYCNATSNFFENVRWVGGAWQDGDPVNAPSLATSDRVFFDDNSAGGLNVIGPYRAVNNGSAQGRFARTAGAGTSCANIWQPSDYTGTPTAV